MPKTIRLDLDEQRRPRLRIGDEVYLHPHPLPDRPGAEWSISFSSLSGWDVKPIGPPAEASEGVETTRELIRRGLRGAMLAREVAAKMDAELEPAEEARPAPHGVDFIGLLRELAGYARKYGAGLFGGASAEKAAQAADLAEYWAGNLVAPDAPGSAGAEGGRGPLTPGEGPADAGSDPGEQGPASYPFVEPRRQVSHLVARIHFTPHLRSPILRRSAALKLFGELGSVLGDDAREGGCALTSTPDGFDPVNAGEELLDAIRRCTAWAPGVYSAKLTVVDLGEVRQVVLAIGERKP